MAVLDSFNTRLLAILAGTHTAGGRSLPAATFTAEQVFYPQSNARFPGGADRASISRRFDLFWRPPVFDHADTNTENELDGSAVRRADVDVIFQYEIALPKALAPTETELKLGAVGAASLRASNDSALLEWACTWTGNWSDIAITCLRRGDPALSKRDELCLQLVMPLRILFEQDLTTSPGLGS